VDACGVSRLDFGRDLGLARLRRGFETTSMRIFNQWFGNTESVRWNIWDSF